MTLHAHGITVVRGTQQALSDLHICCTPGRITAVMGPNGSGKSTLLLALLGLLPLHAGHVALDGAPLPNDRRARAKRLAYVPQRSDLQADLSVSEVVALGAAWHEQPHQQGAAMLARVDATHLSRRSFLTLSGGEAARVLIARALASGATWLLLDEPFAHLDVGHGVALRGLLRRLADAGHGLVTVVHDLATAATIADDVILLDRGRIAGVGPAATVLCDTLVRQVYGVELVPGGALGVRALP